MADPIVKIVEALGTPAGIVLVWWLMNRSVKDLKEYFTEKTNATTKSIDELRMSLSTFRTQTEASIDACHDRITRNAEDVSFLRGRMNGTNHTT